MPNSEKIPNDHLPQNALDFISLVVKKIRYRKKVRKDVHAELTAHFTDALNNITDEKEKSTAAENLINTFGHPKTLATLIRKGKKRCRPLYQKILLKTAALLIILIALIATRLATLNLGKVVISTDYAKVLTQNARQNKDPNQNAAPLIAKAAKELKTELPDNLRNHLSDWSKPISDANKAALTKILNENEKSLNLIHQATQKPYYWRTYKPDPNLNKTSYTSFPFRGIDSLIMEEITPDLASSRKLAYLLCACAYINTKNENLEQATEDIIIVNRFGHLIASPSSILIEQLVGLAITAVAQSQLAQFLHTYDCNADLLKRLQIEFNNPAYAQPPMDPTIEKIFFYDFIQRNFTDNGQGDGRPLGIGTSLLVNSPLDWAKGLVFGYCSRKNAIKNVDDSFVNMNKLMSVTPTQRNNPKTQKELSLLSNHPMLLNLSFTSYTKVFELNWRHTTYRRATLTILAILRYKKETSHLPETLTDLVNAGYLPKIPLDPFADNKPLTYIPSENDFLLYSIGLDLEDDQGKPGTDKRSGKPKRQWSDTGDTIFWPVK